VALDLDRWHADGVFILTHYDAAMEAPASPASPAPIKNRLSIGHFLLWMTVSGLVLAAFRGLSRDMVEEGDLNAQDALYVWLQRLLLVAAAPVYGVAFSGLCLALWRLMTRRPAFPSQPGHWLLLVIAVVGLWAGIEWSIQWKNANAIVSRGLVALAGLTFLTVKAAMQIRRPRRWLLVFGLAACGCLVIAVVFLSQRADSPGTTVPLGLLGVSVVASSCMGALVCGILDLASDHKYDAFHWAGLAALAAVATHPLAAWLIWVTAGR